MSRGGYGAGPSGCLDGAPLAHPGLVVDVLRHGSRGQALETWAFLLQFPLHQAVAPLNHLPDEAGVGLGLDFTQNPGKVMDDITFVRSHWWLVSEGFSLSTANSDVQKLPATLYHRIADSLAYAA